MSQFILIPGLGADAELFNPQQKHFGDRLTVIADVGDNSLWQRPPSMATAASALAERIIVTNHDGRCYVLGGMSFGGSLALEVARRLVVDERCGPPAALALIASNRTSDSISHGFRMNRAIGAMLPRWLVRRGLVWAANLFARREGLNAKERLRLRGMAERANLDQLMWGSKAIASWSFSDAEADAIGVPIEQVHGADDWVIPISPRHATETIRDGKHLITWTHSRRVNAWLEDVFNQHVTT